jgi:hypothetical protein
VLFIKLANNCDGTKFEDVCSTSLSYLERYNLAFKLHNLLVIIAGNSLSPNAFSIASEIV